MKKVKKKDTESFCDPLRSGAAFALARVIWPTLSEPIFNETTFIDQEMVKSTKTYKNNVSNSRRNQTKRNNELR